MKRFLFLALVMLNAVLAIAQQRVTGKVTESDSGEPMAQATVRLLKTDSTFVEGLDGASHHCLGHLWADGRLLLEELVVDAEEALFHLIGVRHDGAFEIFGCAGHSDDGLGYASARAAFCRGYCLFFFPEQFANLPAHYFCFEIHIQVNK